MVTLWFPLLALSRFLHTLLLSHMISQITNTSHSPISNTTLINKVLVNTIIKVLPYMDISLQSIHGSKPLQIHGIQKDQMLASAVSYIILANPGSKACLKALII